MAPRLKQHPNEPADEVRLKHSLLTLAAHRRDAILEAIAESAKELLRSTDLNASLSKVVERVGPATGADRLHIIVRAGDPRSAERSIVSQHFIWNAPGISSPPELMGIGKSMAEVGLGSWALRFAAGETVAGRPSDFEPAARKFLEAVGIKSVLGVPIVVDGEWCGIIGLDECHSEHEWLPSEIDIIRILAELVGAAVVSLRRMQVMADANRIIEASPAIVYRLGPRPPFPLVFVSQNVRRYGYDAVQLVAAPERWHELFHREDLPAALAKITALAEGKTDHAHLEFRLKQADGSYVWFDGEAAPLRQSDGRLVALEGIMTDITERRQAQQKLTSSHVLLSAAIENAPDAVLVVDQNNRITAFNRNFVELWDIPQELVAARDDAPVLKWVSSRIKNEGEFLARVRALYAQPQARSHDELETTDGRIIDRHSAPLRDDGDEYLGRIWFFRDITARKKAERKIVELARSDALTGLPNRIAFLERLQLAFARARRGEHPFAIHYLDLDHFKDINDTLGHPAGDALLKVAAERLKSCVRTTDMIARFGGDEFAVLQEGITDLASAEALAAKICKTMAAPLSIDGNQVHTSASIGIVPYRGDVADPEAMLTKADLALYRAKSEGRDRFRFHIHELDENVRERVMISEGLHSAVENHELELYYQPQVELASGRIIGLEALIRWNHPTRGLLLPQQFIPIAESSGCILQVGRWVVDDGCRQIAQWQRQGIAPQVIAVNISAGQFKLASNLDRVVAGALARHGVAAGRLELELTESVLMEATQRHRDEFERLRHLGVRIAIDDFGIGYSSFDYLHSFRVARLKVDRRFVAAVATNSEDATIVRAIVGLAHELGIDVLAEGVETDEQRAFLIAAGCRFGQGYYFGMPMPSRAATRLLQRDAGRSAKAG